MGEAGRATAEECGKSKQAQPLHSGLSHSQEGSLQERVSLAWNSLSAESPGRWPHPAMPLCSLESGGTDPETISSWVQKDHKDHLSTLGMPTTLGTHPTVHLAGTWFSCCSQQIWGLLSPLLELPPPAPSNGLSQSCISIWFLLPPTVTSHQLPELHKREPRTRRKGFWDRTSGQPGCKGWCQRSDVSGAPGGMGPPNPWLSGALHAAYCSSLGKQLHPWAREQ